MVNHNWWTSLLLLIWCLAAHLCIADGQSENAIGAHRVYEKTSFSCAGRPSGYYADIETGCQVYHMCDGLGRQFSYSCPNTTLFQQRMLICDHWYMVNCSKAESDYTANLLIGQRDKPFVNDDENSQRTPRPDLLDRPYAPDYSGESFRNQYKQLPPVQNQIVDKDNLKNGDKIAASSQLLPGQQRWKIPPPPSRTILPPAFEPQTETEVSKAGNVRFITPPIARPVTRKYPSESTTKATVKRRPTVPTTVPTRRQFNLNNAALHQRQQLVSEEHDDLGTSHSTRYNTSADFNSAEERTPTKTGTVNNRKSFSSINSATAVNNTKTKTTNIKVPSKIYEPPFLYPIYNQNDTPSTIKPLRVSTATPFTLSAVTRTTTTSTTTRPTTLAGKPFTSSAYSTATTTAAAYTSTTQKRPSILDVPAKDNRTPTPAQGFKAPTPRPQVNIAKTTLKPLNNGGTEEVELSALDYKVPSSSRLNIPTPFIGGTGSAAASTLNKFSDTPANDLLPPYKDFIQHDIATTQGPPIYYEWKAPSNGLEPPKLDAPIGTEGREYPNSVIDYNSINAAGGFTPSKSSSSSSFGMDQQKTSATTTKKSYANNPFLASKTPRSVDQSTSKSPTSRSIKDTAQPGNNSIRTNKGANVPSTSASVTSDLTQLREELSVPEYLFPLENIGRTGYLSSGTYNSFQLKIPERRSDNDAEHLHWFGENPKCPECHPSYVKPGTCEPCVRR